MLLIYRPIRMNRCIFCHFYPQGTFCSLNNALSKSIGQMYIHLEDVLFSICLFLEFVR